MYVRERTWLERGPSHYRGFGLYPTNSDGSPNPCFDASRPSWLPYWIDDLTESACYYGTGSLPGQVAGAAAQMATPIGATVGGAVAGTVGGAAEGVASSISSPTGAMNWPLIAAAALGLILFIPMLPGGRR